MKKKELLDKLTYLTAMLKPSGGASVKDLYTVRQLLAHCLVREELSELVAPVSRDAIVEEVIGETAAAELDEVTRVELEKIADEILRTVEEGTAPQEVVRVFRRSVPFLTSTSPMSVPHWADGQLIDQTLGPFLDQYGHPFWFDIYIPVKQVSIVRTPSTTPIIQLPMSGFVLSSATEYSIPKGSVWILSKLLAPTAPNGAYSGVRIKRGNLKLSSPASVVGGTLQINPSTKVTLELVLDPPAEMEPAPGPGGDARESSFSPPAKVTFSFTASGGKLKKSSNAAALVYGNAFKLVRAEEAGVYESLLNRIMLPFNVNPDHIKINGVRSELFGLKGQTAVVGGSWSLSVAVASPESLGEASGVGSIVVRAAPGLLARWRGLRGGAVRMGETILMTEPDRLALIARRAANPRARQTLYLWKEIQDADRCSQVGLHYERPFTLHFISETGTIEALVVNASLEATIDQPLRTDGLRITLRNETTPVGFVQDSNGFHVLIIANLWNATTGPPVLEPFSLALSNALLKVTPPQALFLYGIFSDSDCIRSGTFSVVFPVQTIIPMLPDPYVTNLPAPQRYSQDISLRTAYSQAVANLHAAVIWLKPEEPLLSMFLLRGAHHNPHESQAVIDPYLGLTLRASPSSNPSDTEYTTDNDVPSNPIHSITFVGPVERDMEEIIAADTEAETLLRSIFEEVAGPSKEKLYLLDVSTNVDQFGVGVGLSPRDQSRRDSLLPFQIHGLSLVTAGKNVRVFMLPQIQWEPVTTIPTPTVGPFPSPLASSDDGGPSIIGTHSITLVPIVPSKVVEQIVDEFNRTPDYIPASALFTLPFGMKAAAWLNPQSSAGSSWATLNFNCPKTKDGRFTGGLQLSVKALNTNMGPDVESPSLPGAAYQMRNGIDPYTLVPLGVSVLSASLTNPGVEKDFNDEMGPSAKKHRVPVTRIDFSGYGASMFSDWANPNALATVSQARFDVMVGRTAYEVVQVVSILYPWAVPVVRTITLRRRKEGVVIRTDSGWVATGPGLYIYPEPDPKYKNEMPPNSKKIETHPGVVRGVFNVRRIRETGRVITRQYQYPSVNLKVNVELIEVRFDADFEIEDVVSGQGAGDRVTGCDHVGFVQRSPDGYPLMPEYLAAIMQDEGPIGGPVDCVVNIGDSGQKMRIARVDVDVAPPWPPGVPQFAAAARGMLDLPSDGEWSVLRHDLSVDEPQQVNPISGVPLIREGTAKGSGISQWYRIAEPGDLLQENTPNVEFGLVQCSDGHKVLFPRPRIFRGNTTISSTEKPVLADMYAMSNEAGVFPNRSACFVGQNTYELKIGPDGRYTLGPNPSMSFQIPPHITTRSLVDSSAFAIKTYYSGQPADIPRYTLDPSQKKAWSVEINNIRTSMDLFGLNELMGIKHNFRVGDGCLVELIQPEMVYHPSLDPVVDILRFLTELLGIDNALRVIASHGSFTFNAALNLPIVNPSSSDGYFNFYAMRIKGKLQVGVGNSPVWHGFLKISLGAEVPVYPPIYGGGEISTQLVGSELEEQEVTIRTTWGATFHVSLGPIGVTGRVYFGIEVIVSTGDGWQIGLLLGISGTASIWIVEITVKLELMAAIKRLSPPDEGVEAIGSAKFAAEVTICWFLTISVEYSLEYREVIDI